MRGWRLAAGWVVLVDSLTLLLGACGRPVSGLTDSDVHKRDARMRDSRTGPDYRSWPDYSPKHDDAKRDTSTKKDIGPCVALGATCSVDSDCCPVSGSPAKCIPLGTGVKVCSVPCTPDDSSTPLFNEDSCPGAGTCFLGIPCSDPSSHICRSIDTSPASQTYCLRRCEPTTGVNTCPAGLACDPRSSELVGPVYGVFVFTTACVYPPCKTGFDCPVFLGDSCGAGVPCKAGTTCLPVEPGSATMRCAEAGVCDVVSGLCAPNLGGGKGGPGAPCKSDLDCMPQGRCDFERQTAAGVYARNGYCVIDACIFAKTLTDRACPAGSTCNRRWHLGGRCYKNCDQLTTNCRADPSDHYGDYECYGIPEPYVGLYTCEPAIPCVQSQCQHLGSDLACLDRTTGAAATNGFCLNKCGATCSAGTCVGMSECYHMCVDLNTDKDHCGACGKWCTNSQTCVAGKCVP